MTDSEIIKQLTKIVSAITNGNTDLISEISLNVSPEKKHSAEITELCEKISILKEKYLESADFTSKLSKGNLDTEPPKHNFFISPFKELHSNLRHLVWQTHQIAEGDYNQHIDFLGDFSVSFNQLIQSLKEKQIAEAALKGSEEKYRTLIETMPDGIYRSTPEGKFVEVNPALVKILDYDSREELMSIDIKTDLYFDINDRESAVLKEEKEEMAIYPLRKKDGTRIWVEDHGWVKTDEQGNIIQYEGILRDVSERVNAELQLKKYADELKIANDTKDKLFSIIAHDLRSPFTTLMGYAGLLSDDYDEYSEEERKDMMKRIKDAAQNNFMLLEKLLTWSRAQRGQIKVDAVKVDIGRVSMEVIGILNPVAAAKNIQLTNKITSGTFAWADVSMVHTILLNLTNNAIKFTNPGGLVLLEAGISGDKMQVSVKDNGIGITQEYAEKIFRLDSSHSTLGTANEKGTGLGLLICKEFTKKLGGEIWVESKSGKGSTFIFTLPLDTTA